MAFGMVKIERMRAWETLDLTNSDKDTRMTSHERKHQVFFRQSSRDLSQKDKVEKTSSLSVAIGLTVTAESFLHQPLYFMPSASSRVLVPRGLLLLHSPWPSWLLHGED